jgi:hypothetical protein
MSQNDRTEINTGRWTARQSRATLLVEESQRERHVDRVLYKRMESAEKRRSIYKHISSVSRRGDTEKLPPNINLKFIPLQCWE